MPLNRMAPEEVSYPEHWGTDAVPLITMLQFQPAVAAAFKQVTSCQTALLTTTLSISCVNPGQPGP